VSQPNVFSVGDLRVTAMSDGSAQVPPTVYFPGTTPEQWEPHRRWLDHQGRLSFPFGCFLVESAGKRVLVDTGLGHEKMFAFTGGALLPELAAAGFKPEDVDVVFVTHLHIDHCGTCVADMYDAPRPAFPNAVYRWTSDENAYWQSDLVPEVPGNPFHHKKMIEVVADRFEAADGGASLAPGVDVIAMPGHTPGHAGVVLSSGGERAFLLGDGISCPAQLTEVEWSGLGDMDPKLARRSQEALAKEVEGSGALVGASHFPGLMLGRVLRGEGRRYWEPAASP
jgi:glyoxylase-like metal-dependent hydrolase (beta-lactamase superfamily II)